jgi:glycosyltransferase involved in cell wall biosynthesis
MLSVAATILHNLSHAAAERFRRAWRAAAHRERKLRIGVDVRPFYEPLTGIGWYLYHLLHEIAKRGDVELLLFGDARVTDIGPRLYAEPPPNARVIWFDLRGRGIISRWERAATAAAYVLWMKLLDPDVMFGANYFLPRLLGAIARRRVITIHDLTYKRFPELLQKETLDNLTRVMPREIAAADAIVCVSEATKKDLLEFYKVDPSRVHAIHSGVSLPSPTGRRWREAPDEGPAAGPHPALRSAQGHPLPAGEGANGRYILFVSTIEPRKNLGVLLDAFARLRERGAYGGSLVVVGKIGWKAERIAKRLRAPGVMHLDYLPPEELASVYANAELFVFPSIYEGFGFPLLEAMALGVPSIAARSSSLPEVGGDAALYFDPADSRELETTIERVLRDDELRADLIARGRAQAARFRWSDAAAKTLEVLRASGER